LLLRRGGRLFGAPVATRGRRARILRADRRWGDGRSAAVALGVACLLFRRIGLVFELLVAVPAIDVAVEGLVRADAIEPALRVHLPLVGLAVAVAIAPDALELVVHVE